MANLLYITPTSLDGYIADDGNYDWSVPSEEVHAFFCDLLRPVGTYLYGRKTYETMAVWETPDVIPGLTPAMLEFGRIWQAADKIVYSKSLERVSTPKTRLERDFDPQAIRELKDRVSRDVTIGGPTLAAHAIGSGIVDEYHLVVAPVMLGGGRRILPGNLRVTLDLEDERRFDNGMVYLRYRQQSPHRRHTLATI
jgi:dihydrofolate reductase